LGRIGGAPKKDAIKKEIAGLKTDKVEFIKEGQFR
jgi:hypothetical protein